MSCIQTCCTGRECVMLLVKGRRVAASVFSGGVGSGWSEGDGHQVSMCRCESFAHQLCICCTHTVLHPQTGAVYMSSLVKFGQVGQVMSSWSVRWSMCKHNGSTALWRPTSHAMSQHPATGPTRLSRRLVRRLTCKHHDLTATRLINLSRHFPPPCNRPIALPKLINQTDGSTKAMTLQHFVH